MCGVGAGRDHLATFARRTTWENFHMHTTNSTWDEIGAGDRFLFHELQAIFTLGLMGFDSNRFRGFGRLW